jgi:hypothetical protein
VRSVWPTCSGHELGEVGRDRHLGRQAGGIPTRAIMACEGEIGWHVTRMALPTNSWGSLVPEPANVIEMIRGGESRKPTAVRGGT